MLETSVKLRKLYEEEKMEKITEKVEINGKDLVVETGELARQAGGAVKVSYGDTEVLATCCVSPEPTNMPFFPLTVDYRERTYAAGKIPGGFFKREGRPQEKEIITSRLIDRPIRPLFPEGFNHEVQIMITVLSSDEQNDSDIPAMVGSSLAVSLSEAPFDGPIGSVRLGRINKELIINPTFEQLDESDIDIIVAGKEDTVTMIEGEAFEIPEEVILEAIDRAKKPVSKIIELQKKIIDRRAKKNMEFSPEKIDQKIESKVSEFAADKIEEVLKGGFGKQERSSKIKAIKEEAVEKFTSEMEDEDDVSSQVKSVISGLEKKLLRKLVVEEDLRVDGRSSAELRNIDCKTQVLSRPHGSALFTKGETQSLGVITLGTSSDKQVMDELHGEYKKEFMVHYNFPPYSVGEVRRYFGPKRREIGHGLLAERAIYPVLNLEEFPYTVRLVSDILESNGSSSMATVCAGSMALMDAGVPLKAPVAGVGMGIIDNVILSDMLGDEDHAGDMDFKVAGTRKGVTAIQMDIKISGITGEILKKALERAKEARFQTLDKIEAEIEDSRENLSPYAPQLEKLQIPKSKIGAVIGSGGETINEIQDTTGAQVDIEDDGEYGEVTISADNRESLEQALEMVKSYTEEAEPGKIYEGAVKNVVNFGAFVEILPGQEGLVHISELAPYHVKEVSDILSEGDTVKVKCIKIKDGGKISLSRVKALSKEEYEKEKKDN